MTSVFLGCVYNVSRLKDLSSKEDKLIYDRNDCKSAFDSLSEETQGTLQRTANRIRNFAKSQRASIVDMKVDIPGGHAGHDHHDH